MNAIRVERDLDEDQIIEQLDGIYGEIEICGITFSSGKALLELDPIAFHQAELDLEDSMGDLFECDVCGSQYEDEDEANDCCKPEETTVTCVDCGEEVPDSESVGIPDGGNRCNKCQDKLDEEE